MKKSAVQELFDYMLDMALAAEHQIDPRDVDLGSARCEPYFALDVGGETLVVEGDYAEGVVRVRDIDGCVLVESASLLPLAEKMQLLLHRAPFGSMGGAHVHRETRQREAFVDTFH